MRKMICLHCGEKLIHFGRGHKYAVLKYRGGFIHFNCYNNWQWEKSQRNKPYTYTITRQQYQKLYYIKNRERILERQKAYERRTYVPKVKEIILIESR